MTPLARMCAVSLAAALGAACWPRWYLVRDVPRCVSRLDGPMSRFAKTYCALIKNRDTYPFDKNAWVRCLVTDDGRTRGFDTLFVGSSIIFAVVACPSDGQPDFFAPVQEESEELLADLTETVVPTICDGQTLLAHEVLDAEETGRAERLGYARVFRFPAVDVQCRDGVTSQDNLASLEQLVHDFLLSFTAYVSRHEKLPTDLQQLHEATLAEPLPPDPWGHPFFLDLADNEVRLMTAGPDTVRGTDDDQELATVTTTWDAEVHSFSVGWSVPFAYDHIGAPAGCDYRGLIATKSQATLTRRVHRDEPELWAHALDPQQPVSGDALEVVGGTLQVDVSPVGRDVQMSQVVLRLIPVEQRHDVYRLQAEARGFATLPVTEVRVRPQCPVRLRRGRLHAGRQELAVVFSAEQCTDVPPGVRFTLSALVSRLLHQRGLDQLAAGRDLPAARAFALAFHKDSEFGRAAFDAARAFARADNADAALSFLALAMALNADKYSARAREHPDLSTLRQSSRFQEIVP
ncbi:hypothetical protein ACFL6C_00770 [Myxococcota bacterium]